MKDALEKMDDAALRSVIADAKALLEKRKEERKKDALAEIRKLAAAHGINVAVTGPKRKRGRPPLQDRSEA